MNTIKKDSKDWTNEVIADFWDWQSLSKKRSSGYFTAMVGRGVVRFMSQHKLIRGKVLDYGCGIGNLLEVLIKDPSAEYFGLDFSAESIKETQARTANSPRLKRLEVVNQLPSSFEQASFDTITFIETIEHLRDEVLAETMNEILRLLKPGGKLLVTTPFDEKLENHLVFCPFCKAEFHHMQHMQSFTIGSLTALLEKFGFKVEYCKNVNMENIQAGKVKSTVRNFLRGVSMKVGLKAKININPAPHLVAIAVK